MLHRQRRSKAFQCLWFASALKIFWLDISGPRNRLIRNNFNFSRITVCQKDSLKGTVTTKMFLFVQTIKSVLPTSVIAT